MKKLQKNDRVWFYCSKRTFNFKKHLFWNGHLKSENVIFLKNYYIAPWLFFLLCRITNFYNKNSNVEDVDHDLMATFRTLNLKYSSFLELYHDIEEFTAKSTDVSRKKNYQNKNRKIIGSVSMNTMNFAKNQSYKWNILEHFS